MYEFKLPDIGEGIAEGEIVKWHVSQGNQIQEDDLLVEVMTDKVTVEITSPYTGYVASLNFKEGDVVDVGEILATFTKNSPSQGEGHLVDRDHEDQKSKLNQLFYITSEEEEKTVPSAKVLATPATRKLARKLGIDIGHIQGSGPKNRVTSEDVQSYVHKGQPDQLSKIIDTPEAAAAEISSSPSKLIERVPYRGIRRKIGDHLVKSKHIAPHYTYVEEIDMTEIVNIRYKLNSKLENEDNIKLNYLPFIMKAAAEAMKFFPEVNASLDEESHEIMIKKYYNFGIAVSTERGLIVPVIKDIDKKSMKIISKEVLSLSLTAREDKLTLDQVTDGTFSITSIGSIGGFLSVPIINYPEVAILGVNKISKRPVVRDDKIVIREMMNLSLSLDHRVIDGISAARFVKKIAEYLENPYLLMLEL